MNIKGAFRLGEMGKAFVEPVLGEKKPCCGAESPSPPGCMEDASFSSSQLKRGLPLEPLEEIVVPGQVCVPQCLWARDD